MTAPFTVAIDGPAAAGKGTIARAVAKIFGLAHLDTGLLYRAVGAELLRGRDPLEAARTLDPETLGDAALRTPQVAKAASQAAAMPEVRAALLDFQRAFAQRAGGAVLDGRDIGTVICPHADVKLFVTATPEIRAGRRHAELLERGLETDLETVLADVLLRDARDSNRADAPLKPAEDALILDTSLMDIETAIESALERVRAAKARKDAAPLT